MQTIGKHIKLYFTVMLSFIILLSMSGVSIYTHHCEHSNTLNYSFFIPAKACNHINKGEASCCVEEPVSCCSSDKQSLPDDDCCEDEAKFARLDSKSLLNHVSPTLRIGVVELLHLVIFNANADSLISFKNKAWTFLAAASPPKTTSENLSQIQVYLI